MAQIQSSAIADRAWVASIIRATIALVPLVAIAAAGYWVTHPSSFRSPPGPAGMSGNIKVGEPLHIGMTFGTLDRDGDIHLRDATAQIVEDTTDSTIEFHVCTYAPMADSRIGSVPGDLDYFCSKLEPIDGTTFRWRASGLLQEVLMTITPRQPGRIEVDGMSLTYRDGWRMGTQLVGEHVDFRAR